MRVGRAARGRNTRDNTLSYLAISTVGSEKNIVIVKAFVPCDVRGGGGYVGIFRYLMELVVGSSSS